MSLVGVAIVKECAFRDSTQEWSNVYHFDTSGLPSSSEADALIDYLVAQEKTWHSNTISFLQGRCWSAGGSPASNSMISEKLLTGTGSQSGSNVNMDVERAYLIQWNAGYDSRGHRVKLKKWYHTRQAWPGISTMTSGILANTTGFSTADRNAISLTAKNVGVFTVGAKTYTLASPAGRVKDAGDPTAHKYLEHHQLGDQWRG